MGLLKAVGFTQGCGDMLPPGALCLPVLAHTCSPLPGSGRLPPLLGWLCKRYFLVFFRALQLFPLLLQSLFSLLQLVSRCLIMPLHFSFYLLSPSFQGGVSQTCPQSILVMEQEGNGQPESTVCHHCTLTPFSHLC